MHQPHCLDPDVYIVRGEHNHWQVRMKRAQLFNQPNPIFAFAGRQSDINDCDIRRTAFVNVFQTSISINRGTNCTNIFSDKKPLKTPQERLIVVNEQNIISQVFAHDNCPSTFDFSRS